MRWFKKSFFIIFEKTITDESSTSIHENEPTSRVLHIKNENSFSPEKNGDFKAKKEKLQNTDDLEKINDNIKLEKNEIEPQSMPPLDMYLDTVDRTRLDFDFEKLCSISLSNLNVYACLICGKYFQGLFLFFCSLLNELGRGRSSYAYFHSLDEAHHVYINLHSLKIYVLPESYEVRTNALDDIKYVLNPTYTKEQVMAMDTNT
ncbi:unnamed protein product, partial [Pneumocystis jirovecii]